MEFQVKTNTTNAKAGRNVAMNINIPAAISGYELEEIDLKYVKKERKKSKSNEVSNLLIKYFTNKSSNLHLSSVTKGNEVRPEHYPMGDLKYRRDEYPSQKKGTYGIDNIGRPFLYKNKYPLRLLEKIQSASTRRNLVRQGKSIQEETFGNGLGGGGLLKVQVEGGSLDDIDMEAVQAILLKPSPATSGQESFKERQQQREKMSFPEVDSISGRVPVSDEETQPIEPTTEEVPSSGLERSSHSNWFQSFFPTLLSAFPRSLKSSLFNLNGKLVRSKRSVDLFQKYLKKAERDISDGYVYGYSSGPYRRPSAQHLAPKSYDDPRVLLKRSSAKEQQTKKGAVFL